MIRVCFSEIQMNETPAASLYFEVHKCYSGQHALHIPLYSPRTEEEAGIAVRRSQGWLCSQHS